MALFCRGLDPTAQRIDFRTHHVHTDTTTGQFGNLVSRREARREDQVGRIVLTQRLIRRQHTVGDCLGANLVQMQTAAIVTESDGHVIAFLVDANGDRPGSGLTPYNTFGRTFNTVRHRVAQHMLERWAHAVQHTAVHFDGTTGNVELDLLSGVLGGLTDNTIQTLGNTLELHHAGTQQVALQLPRLAALGNQIVFSALDRTLQVALHGCHVMHGLGHHAGQFLHPGKAVKLERIERLCRIFGLCQTRLHLRLGLQFNVTQLVAQALQIAAQIAERRAQLGQTCLHARTGNHHLARLIYQTVEQLRTHPDRLIGGLTHRGNSNQAARQDLDRHPGRRGDGRRGLRCCCIGRCGDNGSVFLNR